MRRLVLALTLIAGGAGAEEASYAALCEAAIGELPSFSCAEGVAVPVTLNGLPVTSDNPSRVCDRPSLLPNGAGSDGQCVPYSRILDLSVANQQVSVMCRQKQIRGAASLEFDEIDLIAHNAETGATCWFQASAPKGGVVNGTLVPSPTSDESGFWNPPEDVAADGCGNCHDNDPFMHSPFVGQVWAHVPVNPLGRYYHVDRVEKPYGFADWPRMALQMRDSTCIGCHRIGIGETCGQLSRWATGAEVPPGADGIAQAFPLNHSMPPAHGLTELAWRVIHQGSADRIASCCADPGQAICGMTPIAGGEE